MRKESAVKVPLTEIFYPILRPADNLDVAARRRHNRDLALALAAAGLFVFPSSGKVPLVEEWQHRAEDCTLQEGESFRGCTRDTATIRKMWRAFPDAVPSISTGPSGLFVLDCDAKKNGPALLFPWLEAREIDVRLYPMTVTQSGGAHLYFPRMIAHGCAAGIFADLGTDIRGEGGQVVAPGAVREDGKRYLADDAHPSLLTFDFGLADLPESIAEAARAAPRLKIGTRKDIESQLIDSLTCDDWPDAEELLASRYDLASLAAKDDRLAALLATGAVGNGSCSDAQFHLARALWGEYGKQGLNVLDFAAILLHLNETGETEGSFGVYVDHKPGAGEFDNRALARAFYKAENENKFVDGSSFGSVEDDETNAPAFYRAAKARRAVQKALAEFEQAIASPDDPDSASPQVALMQFDGALAADGGLPEQTRNAALALARELVANPAKPDARFIKLRKLTLPALHRPKKGKVETMLYHAEDDENATRLLKAVEGITPLYIRGQSLCTVAETPVQERPRLPGQGDENHAGPRTAAFIPVSPDWLVSQFARHADCRRISSAGIIEKASPPHRETKLIIAAPELWNIPHAFQIAEAPYMLPSGRIVERNGYDAETKIVLRSNVKLPANMPESPNVQDAQDALEKLDGLLSEFPFVDEASRSVALSLILTTLTRNLMDVCPLHAITAPAPGTGKSELAAIATRIAQGRELPAQAVGADEAELGKRIDAAMLAGHPIIALDNVNGILRGDALCQAVTQSTYACRILGRSETKYCANRATIVATGNNIRLPDDMIRRTLLCSLDAGLERPEQRTFKRNAAALRKEIEMRRGELVAAGLTVVRAFVLAVEANETCLAPEFPGFAAWSAYVRSPLLWLGRADPVETQSAVAADDPEGQRRAAIFAAWHDLTRGEPARVRDVFVSPHAFEAAPEDEIDEAAEREREESLMILREQGHRIPGRPSTEAIRLALGNYLRHQKNVIAGGLRLVDCGPDRNKVQRWQTVPV